MEIKVSAYHMSPLMVLTLTRSTVTPVVPLCLMSGLGAEPTVPVYVSHHVPQFPVL
jgi:hypothetical protein